MMIYTLRTWKEQKEIMKRRYQNRIELLQGTLDLLILQTLQWKNS